MGELLALGLVVWLAIVVGRKFQRYREMALRGGTTVKQVHGERFVPTTVKPDWKPDWETDPEPKKIKQPNLEHRILKTAQAHNGIVTPADISIGTEYNLNLERLVARGHAELRATRKGDLVYVFPSLLARNLPEDLEPLT